MTKRIRAFYALDVAEVKEPVDVEAEERCPGESACDIFAAAQNMTGNGLLNACSTCNMLPTKPVKAAAITPTNSETRMDALIDRCYEIRAEQRVEGMPLNRDSITALQWKTLLMIDAITEHSERESAVRLRLATENAMRLIPQIIAAGQGVELK